jgi:hypothetical protein
VSRSRKLPEIAYILMPADMAPAERVSIYHDGGSRLALEFGVDGDFVVRKASTRSYAVRVTVPRRLVHIVPFGIHDIEFEQVGTLLVFDPADYI